MSQKNSILKSRNSDSSSSKKRVSWGNQKVLEYVNQNFTDSQDVNISESDESPLLTPSLDLTGASLSTNHLLQDFENSDIQYLSPVLEEDEHRSLYSVFNSNESNIKHTMHVPELNPYNFKDIQWTDTSVKKKSLKKTPRKDFDSENSINELKELLVRSEAELKISMMQKEFVVQKHGEIKEQVDLLNYTVIDQIQADRVLKESRDKEFFKIVNETNSFHEKYIIDTPDRWVSYSITINQSQINVFKHKSTIIDNPLFGNLLLLVDENTLTLSLKSPFDSNRTQTIWEKFKAFLETFKFSSALQSLQYISEKWYGFVKFSESLDKLLLVSELTLTEVSQTTLTLSGTTSNYNWTHELRFSSIEKDWDIFTSICSNINN